jgi:hypothetical protein
MFIIIIIIIVIIVIIIIIIIIIYLFIFIFLIIIIIFVFCNIFVTSFPVKFGLLSPGRARQRRCCAYPGHWGE